MVLKREPDRKIKKEEKLISLDFYGESPLIFLEASDGLD